MSTDELANAEATIEIDMRHLLRAKKTRLPDGRIATGNDYTSLISRISGQSVYEIDHLIEGLQGVRNKLDNDADCLQRQVVNFEAFSHSIIQLTKIIADGMAFVNKGHDSGPGRAA